MMKTLPPTAKGWLLNSCSNCVPYTVRCPEQRVGDERQRHGQPQRRHRSV